MEEKSKKGHRVQKSDITLHDITTSLALLTRLPIRADGAHGLKRGAQAAWAYPLVGLVLAILAGVVGQFLLWISVPGTLVAGIVLGCAMLLTGAMHEDGLADSADGLWGGWDRAQRLEIMKDSRIGTYGVIALGLSILLRWAALGSLIGVGYFWVALIPAAMLSRAAMVVPMAYLPHARETGLSRHVGRPDPANAWIGCIIAGFASVIVLGGWVFAALICAGLATLGCTALAKSKINGQTGDILGATQQVTEITLLITLATLAT